MKKFYVLCLGLLLATSSVFAQSVSLDYTKKDKSLVDESHTTVGLSVSTAAPAGFRVGVRVEDEMVDTTVACQSRHGNCQTTTKNQEGLVQINANRDVLTKTVLALPVTLYGDVAVGYKSKNAQSGFKYYAGSVGVKTTVGNVRVNVAERLRSPFNEGSLGTGSKYRTYETSVGAAVDLSKKNAAFVKYADERGDIKSHSLGFGVTHSF